LVGVESALVDEYVVWRAGAWPGKAEEDVYAGNGWPADVYVGARGAREALVDVYAGALVDVYAGALVEVCAGAS